MISPDSHLEKMSKNKEQIQFWNWRLNLMLSVILVHTCELCNICINFYYCEDFVEFGNISEEIPFHGRNS